VVTSSDSVREGDLYQRLSHQSTMKTGFFRKQLPLLRCTHLNRHYGRFIPFAVRSFDTSLRGGSREEPPCAHFLPTHQRFHPSTLALNAAPVTSPGEPIHPLSPPTRHRAPAPARSLCSVIVSNNWAALSVFPGNSSHFWPVAIAIAPQPPITAPSLAK
jgi:hypothetical protein